MRIFLVVSWLTISFLAMSLFSAPVRDASAKDDELNIQLKKMEEICMMLLLMLHYLERCQLVWPH